MKEPKCPECGFIFEDEDIWEHGNGFPKDEGECEEVACKNPDCNAILKISCYCSLEWGVETVF